METIQNRIFNYVYHRGTNPVDRVDIQVKWEKIKAEMEVALQEIDKISADYSVKSNDKLPIASPKTR
jgi:hypothetical protein